MGRKDIYENKDEIIKLYCNKNRSITELARQMSCDFSVIKKILLDNKINIRTTAFYIQGKPSQNKINLDKDIVIDLYLNKKMSVNSIATELCISEEVIRRVLKENNIQFRNAKFYNTGRISPMKDKTYEEIYGDKEGKLKREKLSVSTKEVMQRPGHKELLSKLHMGQINPSKGKSRPEFSGEKHPMYGKISSRRGKENSLEHRKKISATKQDIPLEKWEKFTSLEPYSEDFYGSFKRRIRKRDNQICMNCGTHKEKLKYTLECHHVNYNKQMSIPENCISLCKKCHAMTNGNRPYWTSLFQEKMSRLYNYQYSNGEIILELNGKR